MQFMQKQKLLEQKMKQNFDSYYFLPVIKFYINTTNTAFKKINEENRLQNH